MGLISIAFLGEEKRSIAKSDAEKKSVAHLGEEKNIIVQSGKE